MSSSVTSVIRSFAVVLSALSYAAAQVPLGVQMVPNPENTNNPAPYPMSSYTTLSPYMPVETGSPTLGAPPSYYTPPPPAPPPAPPSGGYDHMPYQSFVNGGYSQMGCGYGYQKGYDGKCTSQGWWDDSWGCYQTTIIINQNEPHQYCPPPVIKTLTETCTETKFLTVTSIQPIPTTIIDTVTVTDIKTDTMFITDTKTLPLTVTSTSIVVESLFVTKTDTVNDILTDFVTKTDTMVIPTTVTSIWVKTDIIDMTNTVERTLTSTIVDLHTLTDTLTYLSTSTKTDTLTQLSVSTSTTTQVLQETSLAGCLSQCEQYKNLQPGNSNKYNTYASPPAYTPSPTYQPYQYQPQGGGYY